MSTIAYSVSDTATLTGRMLKHNIRSIDTVMTWMPSFFSSLCALCTEGISPMQVLHQEAQKRITVTLLRRSASLPLLPLSPGSLNAGTGTGEGSCCSGSAGAVSGAAANSTLAQRIAVNLALRRMKSPLSGCVRVHAD